MALNFSQKTRRGNMVHETARWDGGARDEDSLKQQQNLAEAADSNFDSSITKKGKQYKRVHSHGQVQGNQNEHKHPWDLCQNVQKIDIQA